MYGKLNARHFGRRTIVRSPWVGRHEYAEAMIMLIEAARGG